MQLYVSIDKKYEQMFMRCETASVLPPQESVYNVQLQCILNGLPKFDAPHGGLIKPMGLKLRPLKSMQIVLVYV